MTLKPMPAWVDRVAYPFTPHAFASGATWSPSRGLRVPAPRWERKGVVRFRRAAS